MGHSLAEIPTWRSRPGWDRKQRKEKSLRRLSNHSLGWTSTLSARKHSVPTLERYKPEMLSDITFPLVFWKTNYCRNQVQIFFSFSEMIYSLTFESFTGSWIVLFAELWFPGFIFSFASVRWLFLLFFISFSVILKLAELSSFFFFFVSFWLVSVFVVRYVLIFHCRFYGSDVCNADINTHECKHGRFWFSFY